MRVRPSLLGIVVAAASASLPSQAAPEAERPPNAVLIMTDDQGLGDLGATGNPVLRTPNLDRMSAESVRLTDYHVDPTCSPTRSALLTGRYSTRTGVWHTINGRSLMHPDELTLGEVFRANGYRTAMFGKWHLGDNHPCRPQDQGFDHVVWHHGGGVSQAPDYWGNDYFDDTYEVDGEYRKFEGYCTDVWFDEAMRFIEADRDEPFFVYLATNAAHGPFNVADEYVERYVAKGVPRSLARFYGMIENIDENVGRLRARLADLGMTDDTILIFSTDNGSTAPGAIGRNVDYAWHNAGLRASKGSPYDGGHRVPFFVHWPAGGLVGGRDVDQVTAHIDVLPTLVDLCGLKKPSGRPLDGTSLRAALNGDRDALKDRVLFVHSQRIERPVRWRQCAVMTQRWRLVGGKELFDMSRDRAQRNDVAAAHEDVVARLRGEYDRWWSSLEPVFDDFVRIGLGGPENPVQLSSHDWLMPGTKAAPWNQGQVRRGVLANGPWMVDVERSGAYEITLCRWPRHLARAMDCTRAAVTIGAVDVAEDLRATDASATFRVRLARGPAELRTTLRRADGKEHGAYYAYVRFVSGD